MELGLNLLFLVIALFGFFTWMRWRPTDSRQVSFLRGTLVLACILVLLFPLVSITDDLHPISEVVEESSFAARKVHVALSTHTVAAIVIIFQLSTPALVPCAPPPSRKRMVISEVSLAKAGCRAPPLVSPLS